MSSRFKDALNVMKQARTSKPLAKKSTPQSAEAPARAGGKKHDPNYTQVNGYVSRDLYKRVRLALIEDETELGELMERLLSQWLAEREGNS